MHSILNLLLVAVALVLQNSCQGRSILDEIIEEIDSPHLKNGAPEPATLAAGKVRAYVTCYSPFSERVVIALALKQIPTEIININLSDKPDWFTAKTPLGKAPVIEYEGKFIYESLVIVEYLDAVFSTGEKLIPADPVEKAKQFMLMEQLNAFHMDWKTEEGWVRNRNDQKKIDGVYSAYDGYEALLQKSAYLAGDKPGFVDYMNWPFVQQILTVEVLSKGNVKMTAEKYPKFVAYIENMKAIPTLNELLFTPERHALFIDSYAKGKPDFDAHLATIDN